MDARTLDGRGVPERTDGRAAGHSHRLPALTLGLPRQACRWCWREAPASVAHAACDIHVIVEHEAAFYGRVARLSLDTLSLRGGIGPDDAAARTLAGQAYVCARAGATLALELVGREDQRSFQAAQLVRCTRCGNLTRGTREGRSVYCTACGGVVAS